MLIFNEIPTVFPWYDRIEKQNRYKENGEGICDYKLISPATALLPFQFRRLSTKRIPTRWNIVDINTDLIVANVTGALPKIRYKTLGDWDYFYYDGSVLPGLNLDTGFYYSRLTFSDGTFFYSEMFYVPDIRFSPASVVPYIKLEWFNSNDVAPFYYSDSVLGVQYFRNVVYLDSFIHASEPEITEEGQKDGNDRIIPMFQKMTIRYRIADVVPDFLKLALVAMQMHDNITLTENKGLRSGQISNLNTTTSLDAGGFLSTVEILFDSDILIVKKGCASPIGVDAGQTSWM